MSDQPQTIYLKDYQPPAFLVEQVELAFDLAPGATRVRSRLRLRRHLQAPADAPLVLYGVGLDTRRLTLDGTVIPLDRPRYEGESLILDDVPDRFLFEAETEINPEANAALEGLYMSSGTYCTQCEPEGFRRITWYPDRPDVLARFRVMITGDPQQLPVMLANGNLVDEGTTDDGRRWVCWEDPFPKPSYLFALVAGRLAVLEDRFVTMSGREVLLQIYVEERNRDKTAHAMESLKKAMRWDEETFGLEYDLDRYMVVAVDDFNMGAMENKGLNIFNSKYVLARPDTATDGDYQGIEGVIGHEYFHNWTGNRVTCRDWFQLSLKEGLTVFRDQEFSSDMQSRAVKRIEDVRILRAGQFPEDAGPMAHPVRPESYVEINNFYTSTVYNKGAEVIRMQHTLLGAEGFRKGMDLYFERHDGQAVTCDDFVAAMAAAGGRDLTLFKRWYRQAGTPQVAVETDYDASARQLRLTLAQSCPPTPGQAEKEPFLIPLRLGLLGVDGQDLPLRLAGEAQPAGTERVLELTESRQTFVFEDLPVRPVLSLNRGFSAPVRLLEDASDGDLAFRLGHDSDPFNRWEAGQALYTRILLELLAEYAAGRPLAVPPLLTEAVGTLLADTATDPALIAAALLLPAEAVLVEEMAVADPVAIRNVRRFVRKQLSQAHSGALAARFAACCDAGPYRTDCASMARRSLKNVCLDLLVTAGEAAWVEAALRQAQGGQAQGGDNMTDVQAALQALAPLDSPERDAVFEAFYQKWQQEPLVLDKWLSLQATAQRPDALDRVERLLTHPAFAIKNPNKVRALLGGFVHGNLAAFHAADGRGYRFAADRILEIAGFNPQVAARLMGAFNRWRRFDPERQLLMRLQMERIRQAPGLPRDVFEIVDKALAG